MIAAFFGTPCTFACFVIFGVHTLFLVPSRHKTPQKRIFAHYQRSFLLCYGPVWFLSPLHSPSPFVHVQESNHFGGEGVTRCYHTRVPSVWTVTACYALVCLTTRDLEDLFSQSFFAFEKRKEKMKKNDAVPTSMKCKMDQEKTGASFPRNSGN